MWGEALGTGLQRPRFSLEEAGIALQRKCSLPSGFLSGKWMVQTEVPQPHCRTWLPPPELRSVVLPDQFHLPFSFIREAVPRCLAWSCWISCWGFTFLYLGLLAETLWHSWSHNCSYCMQFYSCYAALSNCSPHGFPFHGAVLFPNLSPVNTVPF